MGTAKDKNKRKLFFCAIAILFTSGKWRDVDAFSPFVNNIDALRSTSLSNSNSALTRRQPQKEGGGTFLPSLHNKKIKKKSRVAVNFAGGFAFEDPEEQNTNVDVENPFKKRDVEDDSLMKIDPARLLGPRLQGTNLYFVGMMGSGKSVVGDLLARRKYYFSDLFFMYSFILIFHVLNSAILYFFFLKKYISIPTTTHQSNKQQKKNNIRDGNL
jgi:hypothetical protein